MNFLNGNFTIISKTLTGLEEVLRDELLLLGANNTKILKRGVEFEGDKRLLYTCNYMCRTALRFIVPIAVFTAKDENELYSRVKRISWENIMKLNQTFAVDGITSSSNLKHSKYIALKSKDAIVDRFREKTGKRPSVDTDNPKIRINIRMHQNQCTVSLDSSGDSLHLRGYRVRSSPAPLNEVLAAGIIGLSGWDMTESLFDPMCGSGTIPVEACLMAMRIPPGKYRRDFSFMNWMDYDKHLWEDITRFYDEQILTSPPCKIMGSDKNPRMVSIAKTHASSTGLRKHIELTEADFFAVPSPFDSGYIITNPPYGERIPLENSIKFYKSIGDTLKAKYTGYAAWIFSGDLEALKNLGLKATKKIPLLNGQIECKFQKFEIYSGSKKEKNQQN